MLLGKQNRWFVKWQMIQKRQIGWISAILLLALIQTIQPIAAEGAESLSVVPAEITSCGCRLLAYDIIITNHNDCSKAIELEAHSTHPSIWVSLKPDIIIVGDNSQENLRMYARPACDIDPGVYPITVHISSISGCEIISETNEVSLVIPVDCYPLSGITPEVEPVVEQKTVGIPSNVSEPVSPTGAVPSGVAELDLWKASTILLLVAVIVLLLYMVSEKRK